MNSVLIVAPGPEYFAVLRSRIPKHFNVSDGAEGTVVVGDGLSRAYLAHDAFVEQELEPARAASIREIFTEPSMFTLDYSDVGLCKELLLALVDDGLLWVDNDHGTALPGPVFAARLRAQPDWDWRLRHP